MQRKAPLPSALRILAFALCPVPFALLIACGYSLAGRGNFLPDYIKVIGVPQFTNRTNMPGLDQTITDAVRAELATRRRYQVVIESTGVDAVLTGTINSLRQDVAAFTTAVQASRYTIVGSVGVEFKDLKANKVLWANPSASFSEEYSVSSSTTAADPAAFLSGDKNALDRLAKNFARSIVTSILEAF